MSSRSLLNELIEQLSLLVAQDDVVSLYYSGEDTDFVRFNQTRIRQPGQVHQATVMLTLTRGLRRISASMSLSGSQQQDLAQLSQTLQQLQKDVELLPEDPNLSQPAQSSRSDYRADARLPDSDKVVDALFAHTAQQDVVGILANGVSRRGYVDSMGSRHWFESPSFNLDWSLYLNNGRAIKNNLAGRQFNEQHLLEALRRDMAQLPALQRAEIGPGPGTFRAWLSPSAVQELLELLSWGDLALRSAKTGQSALMPLIAKEVEWHRDLQMQERLGDGLDCDFNDSGFYCNTPVELVTDGRFQTSLITPDDGREYGEPWNSISSTPRSLALSPGNLPSADVLAALDTGLYLSNLWYCNYSDRRYARMTGMTRYACLWVERGKIVGPLASMRFDVSLHDLLSTGLEALGQEHITLLSNNTYGQRHLGGMRLPGMLVNNFKLTL